MPIYHVSYDLNTPGQNYKKLEEEIQKSPGYWHLLGSTWLIVTTESAATLSQRLIKVIDTNDRILVSRITAEHHGYLKKEVWEFIAKYL
jgi:hypothetical protein